MFIQKKQSNTCRISFDFIILLIIEMRLKFVVIKSTATCAEVQKPSQESESESELDGEFENEEYAPNDAVFLAPKINSFGHSFRSFCDLLSQFSLFISFIYLFLDLQ